jgi:predicted lipoprotein with Yx(FWY)xxD motif
VGRFATLRIVDTASVGSIVTDVDGYTLYRFDQDSPKPPSSACKGACAQKWLPALVDGQVVTQGIEQGLVGKVRRADDTWQLTLGGWPLYRYTGDGAPGDTKGEGVAGKWFATAPNGTKAKAAAGGASGTDAGATDTSTTSTTDTSTTDNSTTDNSGADYGAGSGSSGGGY